VVPGVAENLKIISEKACKNIAHFAFRYAIENHRKKVTACHKAGIMFLIIFFIKEIQ
jgi:isocitrate dehydrogenase (NAD+)